MAMASGERRGEEPAVPRQHTPPQPGVPGPAQHGAKAPERCGEPQAAGRQDDDPVLTLELLVHGVGGTTPQAMLGDPRVVRVAGDETAGIYRRADDKDAEDRPREHLGRPVHEAYSWSNLTSGDAGRALWLLLLPFTVVNLAHWMRPAAAGSRPWLDRCYDLFVRLAALSLTVLLVASACEIAMDLVAWQCAGTAACAADNDLLGFLAAQLGGWWGTPGRRIALAAAVPAALTGLLWWLSHRTWSAYESQRPALPEGAPGGATGTPGRSPLSLPGFWYGRRLVARLRAAHTAAGFLTVATAVLLPALHRDHATGARAGQAVGWTLAAVLAALAVWAVVVVDRSGRSEEQMDEGFDVFTVRMLPVLALAAAVLTACYTAVGREGWRASGRLPGGDVFTAAALLQGLLVVLLAFVAWRMHRIQPCHRTVLNGLGGPAVTMLACALGSLMAAGAAHRVADWLDKGATPGGPGGLLPGPPVVLLWQAAAIPPVLAVLFAAAAVAAFRYRRHRAKLIAEIERSHPGEPEQPERTRQIARARARARLTDQVPPVFGTAAMAAFLLGAAAVAGALAFGTIPAEAVPAPADAVARLCQAFGSWLIGGTVLVLIALGKRAYRDAGARRTVGILWDVGTFWPRAAHPFAPPCYAERAVPDLTWRMATWTAGGRRRLVLSGHSQGSVLAAAAVWQLDGPTRDKVALLTYGSPLERLYGRWFPVFFGPGALGELHGQLRAWRNLWRETDPIGGPVRVGGGDPGQAVDTGPLPDPEAYGRTRDHPLPTPILGHSGYRDCRQFAQARSALLHILLREPCRTAERDTSGRPGTAPPVSDGPDGRSDIGLGKDQGSGGRSSG